MIDEQGKSLWARVCATVNRLGQPRSPRVPVQIELPASSVLDLHGRTIHEAFAATRHFIEHTEYTSVLVITGRSGRISYEFPDWCIQFKRIASYSAQNGGGAYLLRLRAK